ncbi:MAG: hypothetical protein AAB917_02705 [Patescibacteria group bacterium]
MNLSSSTARSVKIGLLAIVTVWLTGPLTVPIVKILRGQFSAEELLLVRSFFGVAFSFFLARNKVWKTDWKVKLAGPIIGFSSIGFYRAIQVWDINPVMVIIALLPIVNIAILWIEGKRVSWVVLASFGLLVYGIVLALDPWEQPINTKGMAWALSCAVAGGIGFELWGRASKETTISEKCFWLSASLFIITPIIILSTQLPIDLPKYTGMRELWLLLALGILNGIVYMYGTIIPFSAVGKISTGVTSILLQVTTPFTIIGACYFTGEVLSPSQWTGVAVALSSAAMLSLWLTKKSSS